MVQDIQKKKEYQKNYHKDYYQKNRQNILDKAKTYNHPDMEHRKEYKKQHNKKYNDKRYENALQSLYTGVILNMSLWSSWFTKKSMSGKITYDITATEGFYLMAKKCFYCGEFAITLDRLDSNLTHTRDNCVGCCVFCNTSKGALDPKTFILQSVYRRTFIYYDDEDIWHDNKYKPSWGKAKRAVISQNRPFDLSKERYIEYLTNKCHYCKRMPPKGKFFGVDKIAPDNGYVVSNCTTACASCNRAKWDMTVEEFTLRDERITTRYLEGYFDNMPSISKNTSHRRKN